MLKKLIKYFVLDFFPQFYSVWSQTRMVSLIRGSWAYCYTIVCRYHGN